MNNGTNISDAGWEALLDSLPVATLVSDINGLCIFVNQKWRTLSGMTSNQALGNNWLNAIFQEDRPRVKENWETMLTEGVLEGVEFRFIDRQDQPYWVFSQVSEVFGSNSEKIGYICSSIDINVRMEAVAVAEKTTREIKEFSYALAHDLKAPVRSAKLVLEWLKEALSQKDQAEIDKNMDLLQDTHDKLYNLLTGVLELLLLDDRKGVPELVDLKSMIEEITVLTLDASKVDFVNNVQDTVFGSHRALIHQVLTNLLHNAIEHHDQDVGRIEIRSSFHDKSIMIEVEDDGPGIPPEVRERVFDLFYKVKASNTTGIGLSIVQKAVDRMQGSISIRDAENRGTIFTLQLPIYDPEEIKGQEIA